MTIKKFYGGEVLSAKNITLFMFSPGHSTSVTRAHVHDLYTRHAHTENWGELYEQLHVHNVLSRRHFYTSTKKFPPTFFSSRSNIGKFPIISLHP